MFLKKAELLLWLCKFYGLTDKMSFKNAELKEAYRLPNGVFKATDIGTDIIILTKNSNAEKRDISNYFIEIQLKF